MISHGLLGAHTQPGGCLDEAVEVVLPMIDEDLFGAEITEGRQTAAVRSAYKEAKRCRGGETLQLLASGCTFSAHIGGILELVRLRLPQVTSPCA